MFDIQTNPLLQRAVMRGKVCGYRKKALITFVRFLSGDVYLHSKSGCLSAYGQEHALRVLYIEVVDDREVLSHNAEDDNMYVCPWHG